MDKLKFKNTPLSAKIIYVAFFIFFFVFALVYIYPIFWAILNSLKTKTAYSNDSLAFPTGMPEWWHYRSVFTEFRVVASNGSTIYYAEMLLNSLWILVLNVFVNVCSSAILAYALARFRFPGKNLLYSVVIFANTIPIIGAGPAAYKLIAVQLQFINKPWLIWLTWASGFDFAFIVFYGYFRGVSNSYSESAKMDGANNFTIFLRIILPQVIPCIVAVAITQAMGVWNNYSISMIYLTDYPNLAYGMYLFEDNKFLIETDSINIYFAAAVVSCIPIIVLYASTQNLILTNMTTGGLKG